MISMITAKMIFCTKKKATIATIINRIPNPDVVQDARLFPTSAQKLILCSPSLMSEMSLSHAGNSKECSLAFMASNSVFSLPYQFGATILTIAISNLYFRITVATKVSLPFLFVHLYKYFAKPCIRLFTFLLCLSTFLFLLLYGLRCIRNMSKVASTACPFLARFFRLVWELPHIKIIPSWHMKYQIDNNQVFYRQLTRENGGWQV